MSLIWYVLRLGFEKASSSTNNTFVDSHQISYFCKLAHAQGDFTKL